MVGEGRRQSPGRLDVLDLSLAQDVYEHAHGGNAQHAPLLAVVGHRKGRRLGVQELCSKCHC